MNPHGYFVWIVSLWVFNAACHSQEGEISKDVLEDASSVCLVEITEIERYGGEACGAPYVNYHFKVLEGTGPMVGSTTRNQTKQPGKSLKKGWRFGSEVSRGRVILESVATNSFGLQTPVTEKPLRVSALHRLAHWEKKTNSECPKVDTNLNIRRISQPAGPTLARL